MPASIDGRFCLLALVLSGVSAAYEDGAPPGYTGGYGEDDCRVCHSDNRRNDRRGELALRGLPTRYEPGRNYDVTVTLSHSRLGGGGLQLTLRNDAGLAAGNLSSADEHLEIISRAGVDYLQPRRLATAENNTAAWTFSWTAPAEGGQVTLNVAANAANADSSALGDYIYVLEEKLAPGAVTSRSQPPVPAGNDKCDSCGPATEFRAAPAVRSSSP